jgi:bacteriocin biosynthesis cyclodehydratase domain-containing protein
VLIEFSQRKGPHLLIHLPIGDEVVVGPLVLPGTSPCNRCLSLYEIDNFGYTRLERIPLTPVNELPMAVAHYIAAIVAAEVLHFIDGTSSTGGEVRYINFQNLTAPQVVAIARHPLCGCAL